MKRHIFDVRCKKAILFESACCRPFLKHDESLYLWHNVLLIATNQVHILVIIFAHKPGVSDFAVMFAEWQGGRLISAVPGSAVSCTPFYYLKTT
jgi:hypothetical protein